MKKILCILLAAMMAMGATACAVNSEQPAGDSVSAESPETSDESEVESENLDYVCEVPTDLKIGGSVTILYSSDPTHGDELVPDSKGGIVSDSVKERNMKVEEQLGIKLNLLDRNDCQTVTQDMAKDVLSKTGDYELVANGTYVSVQPILEGRYIDLSNLEYIDTSKHYWTQGYNDMVTFTDEDMQFLVSGPIAISMFRLMYLTLYNKQMFEDYGLPDLYETVKAGEWTLDYQYELISNRQLEMDNKPGQTEGDFYGFVTGDTISVDPYMVAADLHLIIKDSDSGDLIFNGEDLSRLSDLCDKVQKLYNDKSTYVYQGQTADDVNTTDIIKHFIGKRALMVTTLFLQMEKNFDALSELSYGIAPMPKFVESQSNYHSYVQDQVTCFGVSAAVTDAARRDELSAVLEVMAYYSYQFVRPAYYDIALSERYMQDPQSGEILDMISGTVDFDFSSTCSNIFGTAIRDLLRPLFSDTKNTVSSTTAGWETTYNRQIERTVLPKLEKLQSKE